MARSTGLHGPVRIETIIGSRTARVSACSTGLHGPVRIETFSCSFSAGRAPAAPAFTGR